MKRQKKKINKKTRGRKGVRETIRRNMKKNEGNCCEEKGKNKKIYEDKGGNNKKKKYTKKR